MTHISRDHGYLFTVNVWDALGNWTVDRISCRHSAPTSFLVLHIAINSLYV